MCPESAEVAERSEVQISLRAAFQRGAVRPKVDLPGKGVEFSQAIGSAGTHTGMQSCSIVLKISMSDN
jgi:hypothetical protein